MNDAELLIRIRTALESGGLDAAKRGLEELTRAQSDSTAASAAGALKDADLAKAKNDLDRAAGAANQSLNAMAAIMRGDLNAAMQQIIGATGRLDGSFAKLGAAGAGFAIGWKLGTVIDQTLGLSDAFARLVNRNAELNGTVRITNEELNKLAATNLDALTKQLDKAQTAADRLARASSRAFSREEGALGAQEEEELARAQALPPGADREAAIAATRAKYRDQRADLEARRIASERKQAQSRLADLQSQLSTLDSESAAAQSDVDRLKPTAQGGPASPQDAVAISNAMKRLREVNARRDAARERIAPQIEDLQSTLSEDLPARDALLSSRRRADTSRGNADSARVANLRGREELQARLDQTQTQREAAARDIASVQSRVALERLQADQAAAARDALPEDSSISGRRRRFSAGVEARTQAAEAAQAEKEGVQAVKGLVTLIKQLTAAEAELRSQLQAYR